MCRVRSLAWLLSLAVAFAAGSAVAADQPTAASAPPPAASPATPGPAAPGPATPGPATPGPATSGTATSGTATGSPAAPAVPGKAAAESEDDPVVARVNGVALYRSDVEAARGSLNAELQKLPLEKVFPMLLRRLINGQLLIEAGNAANLGADPDVQHQLALEKDHLIQQAYIDKLVADNVTEAVLKARYDAYVKEQPPQEEVRAQHILVPTEAEAQSIIDQLNKGADFATLAAKYSKDTGGAAGGDLGWFTRDQMVPPFAAAAFSLPVGQYSKTPVKTEFGWHVIKVEGRRVAPPPTFAQVHDKLFDLMANEVVDARLKALREVAQIQTFGPDGKPLPAAPETSPAPAAPAPGAAPAPTPAPVGPTPQAAPAAPKSSP